MGGTMTKDEKKFKSWLKDGKCRANVKLLSSTIRRWLSGKKSCPARSG